ncbi:MAG: hypothetical protein JWN53_2132 [Gemmatimonadetes bacterium]|jgi:hypothetical protein|nr:hypothetical protein [Gemmatimonadota bacterium]
MIKFAIIFIIGLSIGYAYGYQQGGAGEPSILQRIVGTVGGAGQKVKAEQDARERAADSVSAPIRH